MKKTKINQILNFLNTEFPEAKCELEYSTPYQLLVAVILSAQCTDKRVNLVTEKLFKLYNTPEDFAKLENSELEKLIYSCGFYKNLHQHNQKPIVLTLQYNQYPCKIHYLLKYYPHLHQALQLLQYRCIR